MSFEKYFYPAFVFITGSAIMMLEMSAFRLATPYFGASLFVWANIIGLVMIALAAGYYFGGKIADIYPKRNVLMFIALGCGVIVSFVPLFYRLSLPFFVAGSDKASFWAESAAMSSFLFTAMLFILPLTILGMVSPFVIRLRNKELATTGVTAGSIYAIATLGSVFGTFFSSFLAIPFWGVKETILLAAFSLIVISLVGLGKNTKKSLLLFLLLPFLLNFIPMPQRKNLVYEEESFYGLIEVIAHEDLGYVLDINRSGRWSVYHPEKILTSMYFDYFLPLYFLVPQGAKIDVLKIGHAAGTTSRQYLHFFGKEASSITGVELDPEVTRTAYKFFDLGSQEGVKVVNEDGRTYLQKSQQKYDLILSDAYVGSLYIPFQLATREFFQLAQSRLKEQGILAMMVLSEEPSKERVFLAFTQTMKSVFPYVYFFPSKSRREHFVVGSRVPLGESLVNLAQKTDIEELKEISLDISHNFEELLYYEEKYVLTDNLAPTEMLRELDLFSFYFKELAGLFRE